MVASDGEAAGGGEGSILTVLEDLGGDLDAADLFAATEHVAPDATVGRVGVVPAVVAELLAVLVADGLDGDLLESSRLGLVGEDRSPDGAAAS